MIKYPQFKKVLFCTDFSENSDYAFEFALGIAKREEGLLYILHVIPGNPQEVLIEDVMPKSVVEKLHKVLKEETDNKYKERYLNKIENEIKFEVVTKAGKRENEEIIKFAKEKKVDIIVMGTKGRTGIENIFFGSIAGKVSRSSPFPVLVIPYRKKTERLQDRL